MANNTEVTDFDILVILIVMLKGHDLHREKIEICEQCIRAITFITSNSKLNVKLFYSHDANDILQLSFIL